MPVVQTDQVWFDGPFKRQVKFTKKEGFTCALPASSHQLLGISQTQDNTLAGCLKKWDEAIKRWTSASTTTREVLVYQVHRKAYICVQGKDVDDPWRKCIFSADELHFEEGMGLTVCAGVFAETKVTLGSDTRYTYDLIRDRLPPSIEHGAGGHSGLISGRGEYQKNALPTTPELEAFFTNVALGMEKLILMFDQLKDQQKVLAFAAAGTMLLPAPAPEVTEKSLPAGS